MVSTTPTVSVIVPCRNERDSIETCLRSILAQDTPAGGFEVVVADGLSDDGTREILKRLEADNSSVRVVDNPAGIVSTGLNEAIEAAKGQIIVRMDAHTEYASDYLRQCVTILEETGADNVGGPWIAKGYGSIGEAIAAAFQSHFCMGGARSHNQNYQGLVDTVYLGCWRRGVFDRVGFFDENLVRNQDDEFNLRLTRAGGKIWQSSRIRSWYNPRGSLRALFRQYMQYGYWKIPVIQKHKIPASVRHVIPGVFVLSLVMLPLMSLLWAAAGWFWLAIVGVYSICNLAASGVTAARRGYRLLPFLPFVFAVYHIAYGYGFLRGTWDFVVLGRKPKPAFVALTRSATSVPLGEIRKVENNVPGGKPRCRV
jgi:succinoglycan biosynthesis protein ExoA